MNVVGTLNLPEGVKKPPVILLLHSFGAAGMRGSFRPSMKISMPVPHVFGPNKALPACESITVLMATVMVPRPTAHSIRMLRMGWLRSTFSPGPGASTPIAWRLLDGVWAEQLVLL